MTLPLPETLRVPLFPLPGVVLFPGTVLPLRVFEPRYLDLLRDALADQKLIGMAHLKPASKEQAHPAVFDVLGVGRVVAQERCADGTWHIALLGQWRCRIQAEVPHAPYRMARVDVLKDSPPKHVVEAGKLRRMLYELKQAAATMATRSLKDIAADRLDELLEQCIEPGAAADLLGSIFVHDHAVRQALLENTNVSIRVMLVKKWLDRMVEQSAQKWALHQIEKDFICLN